MNYDIIVLPKALGDIRDASTWYLKESPGLEKEFWEEIYQTLQRISAYPSRFSLADSIAEIRRAKPRRFPYNIYFYTNEAMHRVEIIAIVHKARDPRVWKKRI